MDYEDRIIAKERAKRAADYTRLIRENCRLEKEIQKLKEELRTARPSNCDAAR